MAQETTQRTRSGLFSVFQLQKGKSGLSISNLFGGQKAKDAQALHAQAQEDVAAVIRALSGGLEVANPKNHTVTPRGLVASEARMLLERTASKLTVAVRAPVLQVWCNLLKADTAVAVGDDASSGSMALSSQGSTDSATAAAVARAAMAASAAKVVDSATSPVHRTTSAEDGAAEGRGCLDAKDGGSEGSQSDFTIKAGGGGQGMSLFDDSARTNICFRDLFLKSLALELVLKGFVNEPPSSDEEESLLLQLLQLTLVKQHTEYETQLVEVLVKLGTAMASHPNLKPTLKETLVNVACQAISGLKAHGELGNLERHIEEVQSSLVVHLAEWADLQGGMGAGPQEEGQEGEEEGQQEADLHLHGSHKWQVAQQVWELSSELKGLTAQRHAILERAAAFDYSLLRRMVEEPASVVEAEVASLQLQLDETSNHLEMGAGFRSERFGKVKAQLMGVSSEISNLEGRKMELLAELEKVDSELRSLYKVQSDLEEERNVFEEGSALTLESLGEQEDVLRAEQASALMEAATLRSARTLVSLAAEIASHSSATALRDAEEARSAATEKVLAAAGGFCRLQQQELARCVAVMQASAETLKHINTKQMYDDILHYEALEAVAARRQDAVASYLDAEMAAFTTLNEISQVQDSVRISYRSSLNYRTMSQTIPEVPPATSPTAPVASPPSSPRRFSRASTELNDSFASYLEPSPLVPPAVTHLELPSSPRRTRSISGNPEPSSPSSPRRNRSISGNSDSQQPPSRTRSESGNLPPSPSDPPSPPQSPKARSGRGVWPSDLSSVMSSIESLRRELESIQRPDDVTKYNLAAAVGPVATIKSTNSIRGSLESGMLPPQLSQMSQMSPQITGSPQSKGGGATHGSLNEELDQGEEEFPSTCDSGIISYAALMGPSEAEEDERAPVKRMASTTLAQHNNGGSSSSSPRPAGSAPGLAGGGTNAANGHGGVLSAGSLNGSVTGMRSNGTGSSFSSGSPRTPVHDYALNGGSSE